MYLSYDEDMTRGKENLRRSLRLLLLLLHNLLQTVGLPVTLRRPSNNAPSNTPSGYRKYWASDKNAAPPTHLLPLRLPCQNVENEARRLLARAFSSPLEPDYGPSHYTRAHAQSYASSDTSAS
jgi:hypothetical protein